MGAIKINGATSGSTTITAPATGGDESIELSTALASKADYPTGGSNGDLLTKSGTTTAWAAPSVAGLTLITAETFSAVSSVSVDGCFTSTYQNYRVVFSITKSTTLTPTMRWRVSSSDNTSSVYDRAGTFNSDNITAGGLQSLNQSSMGIGVYDLSTMLVGSGDIIDPQLAQPTFYVGQHFESDAGTVAVAANYNFIHSNSTAFDGFSIIASTGTITGVVRVYGYKD